ncbi:tetratricopeptide repeat protein [Lyngbya confervoides]|uniref:Tetratricopeptide repeat protein n=1 Tax=Lyngbya confervoides BDU141951 TaxID=1574623 RepID=A0ABD4T702_9CYAN|nr:tetratricopeptide repeat protein [Lyngbya confervoides]MCM1984255.1 tetratricopeptide repeat protein [Lyngbya confervoides BDU141951]
MNLSKIPTLLAQLQSSDADLRNQATESLWETWFWQKGLTGMEQLQRSQSHLDRGDFKAAEAILNDLIDIHPDFAEAWNRRAVLHYLRQDFQQAIEDCKATLALVPYHFGALHGLGLSYAATGNIPAAIQAFQSALEIQPHALINQKLLLECMAQL